jgi:predicted Ser/Thr protein kinase
VPPTGFEPAQPYGYYALNVARLPIPPRGQVTAICVKYYSIRGSPSIRPPCCQTAIAADNLDLMIQELILDRYRVIERIGRGGHGEVFKAEDTLMSRVVAIKRIEATAKASGRALNEARAAGQLNHPNVMTVHDLERDNEFFYLVMEYIDGVTLSQVLAARSPLTIEESLDVAIQIADALEAAHTMDIVHRDIKPDNIMITKNGDIKVTDFGIAKLSTSTMTADGDIMGTLAYMSPEQAKGGRIDARTDIFSLGVVLYQMLTGASPFASATPAGIVFKITSLEPQPLGELNDRVSFDLDSLVMRMLEKKRSARLDDITVLRHYLEGMRTAKVSARRVIKPLYRLAKAGQMAEPAEYSGPLKPLIESAGEAKERATAFVKRHRKFFERFGNALLATIVLTFFLTKTGFYTPAITSALPFAYFVAAFLFPRLGLAAGFALLALPVADYSLIMAVFFCLGLFMWWLSFYLIRPLKSVYLFVAPILAMAGSGLSFPLITGLLFNPLEAIILGIAGGFAVEFLYLFNMPAIAFIAAPNSYGLKAALAGSLNPITATVSLFKPFLASPLLIVQPILWGGVAAIISVTAKRRSLKTDFYGLVFGTAVLLVGQVALMVNFQWGTSYVDALMKTLAASLILPLGLLPILSRRSVYGEDYVEEDEDEEEEEE